MFLIRQSKPEDVGTLIKLARTVYFINLPPNEQVIASKIEQSARCFRALAGRRDRSGHGGQRKAHAPGLSHTQHSDFYMFTILDADTGAVIGTSQLISRMGGRGDPNWAMRVIEKKFYSESLRFGTHHTVAQLYGDETGPTEIGGLVLDPGFRGHRHRPGRFLSFVRFLLIGMYRQRFAERILAEMMAPVTADGDNAFWDCFGRKFIPVKYAEADRFCQFNRSFITDLLPKEEIYLTLLPLEVLNQVGQVGPETLPARKLLESVGFRYRGFIDPFDGGPHLDAPTNQIPLVREVRRAALGKPIEAPKSDRPMMVGRLDDEGEFRAVETPADTTADGALRVSALAMKLLDAQTGERIGFTPSAAASSESAPPAVDLAVLAPPRRKSQPRKASV